MNSTPTRYTAGRDSALPSPPSGEPAAAAAQPGLPVEKLRPHSSVGENKNEKNLTASQKKKKRKRNKKNKENESDSGDREDFPDLQSYKEQRTVSADNTDGFWKIPKGYAKWLSVVQTGGDNSISKLSMFKIKKFLLSLGINSVHGLDRKVDSLDIHLENAEDSARLLRCTTFCDLAVTVEPHSTLNFSKGVVKSNEFRFVDADEMETIPGVKKAVPILAFRDGEKVKTGTWILTFDSLVCPEYINVCWLRVQVNAFIPKPLRCFKCQRFGHMGSKCKSKIDRCMQCAAPEKHTNCKLAKKCSNCLEAHSASDKNCQVYKETQLILRHQAENGGTFASSRRILFPSGTTYSRVARRQSPNHSRDAPGQSGRSSRASDRSSQSTGKSSQTTDQSSRTAGQSSGATDKANETVLDDKFESMNEDAPGQSDQLSQAIGESSRTADQSSEATDKANEIVIDDKLESMNEDANEMEPACEITPAETDEKEVSVISDRKAVSSDGKDDLVSQFPLDFIAPTAKKKELYVPEKCQLKMKYGGFKHGVKPQGPLSKRKMWSAVMNLEEDDKMRHSPAIQVKKNLNSIRRHLNRGSSIEKVSNLIND